MTQTRKSFLVTRESYLNLLECMHCLDLNIRSTRGISSSAVDVYEFEKILSAADADLALPNPEE